MSAFSQVYIIYTFSDFLSPSKSVDIKIVQNCHENYQNWPKMLKVYRNHFLWPQTPESSQKVDVCTFVKTLTFMDGPLGKFMSCSLFPPCYPPHLIHECWWLQLLSIAHIGMSQALTMQTNLREHILLAIGGGGWEHFARTIINTYTFPIQL